MVANIIIMMYLVAAIIALIKPKWGMYFFFPIILSYPAWLLWDRLPLNAGFDDVFLICLFVGSLIRSQGRLPVKWPVVAAVLFCVIAVLGDLSSILAHDELALTSVWKRGLKGFGLILFVFSLCSQIKTPGDIRKVIYSLLIGAVIGGSFVIFYSINKYAYNPFQVPAWAMPGGFQKHEPLGPFITHDTAGGVLGFTVLMGYFLLRFKKDGFAKLFVLVLAGILLLGLILSNSRSGWLFAAVPIMLSSLLSKQKILGIFLLVLIIIGFFISAASFETLERRLEKTSTQWSGEDLQSRTAGRYEIWKEILSKPTKRWLFFGEGFAVEKTHPHSNYIAMLKDMGCIGILFWVAYYVKIFRKSSWLRKYDTDRDMSAVFIGAFWSYIGYFVFFLTATPMMWAEVRYIDFFLMALICLRYNQIQVESEDLYQEESYASSLAYA